MQKYKEINGNDYVKNSRTTINETMQSIQSMNSGTAFPTNNLFEGMKCYRTDLKKTYTLTDVENNTWVEDAHATLSDEATHAASATKLQTARSLNLGGAVTADAATFDGTANATINVKTLDATKLKGTASVSTTGNAATASKLSTARKINITGNATGAATFDGTSDVSINVSVSQAAHADRATADKYGADIADNYIKHYINVSTQDLNDIRTGGLYAQSLNANATTARHYPENEACSILVIQNGANGVDGCTQICTTFASHNSYKREYDVVSKTWSAWRRYAFEDSTVSSAQKLSTARKINITGNASGAAAFDGTSDVNINVSVSQAAHADKATADANGNELANAQRYMHVYDLPNNTDFNNVKTTGIYTCTQNSYTNRPASSRGVLRVYWLSNNVKQEYVPDNRYEVYERYFTGGTWNAWSKVNAANADTAAACSGNSATATKLATARAISLTGNASGSATFDGSGNVSINATVNESKHAAAATTVNATAPNGGAADLAFGTMAVNDYARIRVYGKDDNGALEIATADGGNEPIYARQYSGAYDWPKGRPGTVTNEAAILDSNGNTKFPKNVTAASFTGPLNGNAATASKLNTVGGGTTTFNWVGKAGQPNWLWGGNNSAPTKQYVYNPSNFHVASANTATSATTAGNVSNKIYYSADSPSVATDKLFTVKQAHAGKDNVPNNGLVIQSGPTGANYNGKLYITDNGSDGVWIGGVAAGKEVGWTRLVENKGTWNISISGNAASATNADKLDGYHASDILNRITDITPKTAAAVGQFREFVVNDSHQVKLPDGGTWAYFCYTYNSWSGDDSNGEHRTRTGAGIAAGGTVIHTDGSITSNTINAFKLSGTTGADGADGNTIIVGGFCWRIA